MPIGAGLMPDFASMEIPADFLNFVEDFNTPEELVMSGHFELKFFLHLFLTINFIADSIANFIIMYICNIYSTKVKSCVYLYVHNWLAG